MQPFTKKQLSMGEVKMKKLISLALCIAMMAMAVSAFAADDKIYMGDNLAFPPFEYVDDNGEPAGFDIEIAKLIAADLGKELKVEDMAFDGLLMALDSGSVDFVIAAMTINEERLKTVDFSDPYFEATQQVIMRADATPITKMEDLAGMSVSVQEGTTGHTLCQELGVPDDKIVAFKTGADAVLELKAGRVDAVVIDTAPAKVFTSQDEELVIVEGLDVEPEYYGVAVKKGNTELIASINATLAKIKEDGTYDKLLAEFFSE